MECENTPETAQSAKIHQVNLLANEGFGDVSHFLLELNVKTVHKSR